MKFMKGKLKTTVKWDLFKPQVSSWEDAVIGNVDQENDRLAENLRDCAEKAESFTVTKRRLSPETLGLIRQR